MLGIDGHSKSMSIRTRSASVVAKKSLKQVTVKLPAVVCPPALSTGKGKKTTSNQKRKGKCTPMPSLVQKPLVEIYCSAPVVVNALDIAMMRLNAPPGDEQECGTVMVRFNHYNKSFPIYNGVLKWTDIDEEYCLSFVYRGNYSRELVCLTTENSGTRVEHDDAFMYYINMVSINEYRLEVAEDPQAGIGAEGLRLIAGPLKSSELSNIQSPQKTIKSTTVAMDTITAELKSIAVADLSSSHAKDLIERRDLEDILYSG